MQILLYILVSESTYCNPLNLPYVGMSRVGDAKNLPVLIAKDTFVGIAVIDADVYIPGGNGDEWSVWIILVFPSYPYILQVYTSK